MRVIAYCRVSTDGQADGSSLDAQADEIRAWATREGHQVEAVYRESVSGTADVDQRPVLQEALAALAALVDAGEDGARLVVVKRNRLARDVYVAAALERVTGKRVVSLDSTGEGPEAELMRSILDAFAAYERAQIVWRCALGKRRKRESGGWTGGRPPWGLRLEGTKSAQKLVVDSDFAAKAIAHVFDMLARGETLQTAADFLNSAGVATRGGATWNAKGVQRVRDARGWYVNAGVLPDKGE
jgi:DNA invertase Pin-like site-specific DNA recombinase